VRLERTCRSGDVSSTVGACELCFALWYCVLYTIRTWPYYGRAFCYHACPCYSHLEVEPL
jgi:hypothetical protein